MKTNNEFNVYFWNKITIKDKALLYEHLSNLIDGGVTATNALKGFLDKTLNPKLGLEITNLLLFIESGDSFSTAMKKMPFVFNRKEVAIIEAGESSGTLQKSFLNLSKQLNEEEDLRRKVKGALTYPTIILLFLIIAVFVIMTYVIPKIQPLFESTGIELPLSTRALIFVSEFFINDFYTIIIGLLIAVFSFKAYIKTNSGKRMIDDFYISIPLVGTVYKNYLLAQIASNLGLLIGAGIPIVKTFALTGDSSNNSIYKEIIYNVSKSVSSGKKITQSLEDADPQHKYFKNDFVQMIEAGEKTSTINKVCDKIAYQYSKEVDSSLAILMKWIEPAALLIAGIFVLWFAFAIFSAVLKITETVS
ncbi:MAG: type II secretion system F family protein [Candidatus Gracilibacteria bacterium]|nr:type II secretion system F family protein [Candidatus Gracilibacteria bacterium]